MTGKLSYRGRERRKRPTRNDVEPLVLTQKLAGVIDGIVLAGYHVGDRICLVRGEAALLIAEGWARPVPASERRRPCCAR